MRQMKNGTTISGVPPDTELPPRNIKVITSVIVSVTSSNSISKGTHLVVEMGMEVGVDLVGLEVVGLHTLN